MTSSAEPLLNVRQVVKHYRYRSQRKDASSYVRAVDGVDLTVHPGETVALVGESGCGKTTLGRIIVGLIEPTAGVVEMEGQPRPVLGRRGSFAITRHVQMIFQDPAGSLNPRLRVGDSIAEPLRAHRWGNSRSRRSRVAELLETVGLEATAAKRFPHEFSGGQRQRIGIARALSIAPKLVVADEPTSALDVSVRAQILNLLRDLGERLGTSFLLISHDLAAVRHYSRRVSVMQAGKIVEEGLTAEVLSRSQHPYTQELLRSVPSLDPSQRRLLGATDQSS